MYVLREWDVCNHLQLLSINSSAYNFTIVMLHRYTCVKSMQTFVGQYLCKPSRKHDRNAMFESLRVKISYKVCSDFCGVCSVT